MVSVEARAAAEQAATPWLAARSAGCGRRPPICCPSEACGRTGVVINAKRFDHGLSLRQADKPVFVQTLIAKLPVEDLHDAFSIGLPSRMKRSLRPLT